MYMNKVIPFDSPFSDPDRCARHIEECLDRSDADFEQPHFRERLRERDITMRQVLSALQKGEITDGPKRDSHNDFRVKMKRYVASREIQMVVALNVRKCTVVTVI